jgi:uncharacterized protein (TIGR04255 family)
VEGQSYANVHHIIHKKYTTWEEFNERLNHIIDALDKSYKITSYARIGLRYINVFKRSYYGLEETPWGVLFKPESLGMLGSSLTDNTEFSNACEMKFLHSFCRARIVTNIVTDISDPRTIEEKEKCLMLDIDVYNVERTPKEKGLQKLGELHTLSKKILRNAITDDMDRAMEPI